ncbi:MAG: DUF1232 domain-containing protein [Flavobacteriales bacterium]|nr:DUF1232 domain-containing protein [Flavobacteriales bacterium]
MNKAYTSAFNSALNKATEFIKSPSRVSRLIIEASRKIGSNNSSLTKVKNELSTLLRLLKSWGKGDYKNISRKTILSIIAALLYFVNPIDIIPDIIPVFGFTDDATILFFVLNKIRKELDEFENWENQDDE